MMKEGANRKPVVIHCVKFHNRVRDFPLKTIHFELDILSGVKRFIALHAMY
jgi:hypothetical protein